MNWNTIGRPKPEPEAFSKRRREIFAFLPHKAENGRTYWLERIIVQEFYGPITHMWRTDKFYPVEK